MKGLCPICKQQVNIVFDEGEDVIDAHEDGDGHACEGSGQVPAGEFDDVDE